MVINFKLLDIKRGGHFFVHFFVKKIIFLCSLKFKLKSFWVGYMVRKPLDRSSILKMCWPIQYTHRGKIFITVNIYEIIM